MSIIAEGSDTDRRTGSPLSAPPSAERKANLDSLKGVYHLLAESQLATASELAALASHGQEERGLERQVDPLEILVMIRGIDPDARPIEIERLGRSMATALKRPLALPPFASRLSSPTAFYDTNPAILAACQSLMTPVIFAEESEVIGVGSINPVALLQIAERIISILGERTGTKPLVSPVLLTHEGWLAMCHKQLGI